MNSTVFRIVRFGGLCCVVVLGFATDALAKDQCTEVKGPIPSANAKKLKELAPNPQRPSLTMPLDSGDSASDDIALPVKGKKRIGLSKAAASADFEKPRMGDHPLRANVRVAAAPTALGTGVRVYACISNKRQWEAGTFTGSVTVYGPRFSEFSYPLVVTSKWPVWVPVAIILSVLLIFGIMEALRQETGKAGTSIYFVIAIAAGAATYFGQYDSVATWGDNPGAQLTGLAVAVVTAAAAGRGAAKKYFSET